jgi:hypothetical protein
MEGHYVQDPSANTDTDRITYEELRKPRGFSPMESVVSTKDGFQARSAEHKILNQKLIIINYDI